MSLERIAAVCFWIVVAGAVAPGQQKGEATGQPPQALVTRVTERTYPAGGLLPWRHVETRSEADGRVIVVETEETTGMDGKLEPSREMRTETVRAGATTPQTRRDLFGFDAQRRRRLLETTQSEQETVADANIRIVESRWARDINGRLGLASRRIEARRSIAPDIHETDTTLLLPGINDALRESERTEHTERQINPAVMRQDITQLVFDVNGRWQPIELRSVEIRGIGSSERLEEETIRRPDTSGTLVIAERSVTRRSEVNGAEQVTIETYSQYGEGFIRSNSQLALNQRVHVSTAATADGGRYTVEEVEARNPVAPGDPLRVIHRTMTSVSRVGRDQWVTERHVLELDLNGRLVPVITEREESAGSRGLDVVPCVQTNPAYLSYAGPR
jgi:hypothetical protein